MTLEECLDHYKIPYTADDIRLRPMELFTQLRDEIHLAAEPFVHTASAMAWHNHVHEWQGYTLALNHLLLWVLDARGTCEAPGALALLGALKAYLEREIAAVPDLS
jgi:hypothetical protein